jgi:Calcineurin-like phosphoesterase
VVTRRPLRSPSALLVALVAAGVAVSAPARAGQDICNIEGVSRIVAVGDVHGSYDGLLAVLRMAGLVDDKAHWSGGRAHLVQVGDFLDRGEDARHVLELLMRLPKEAEKGGGAVHVLLGNHEVMNILGDLRYVNPEEYGLFRSLRADELRKQLYRSSLRRAREAAKQAGQRLDEAAFREKFFQDHPLGFVERKQAFSAQGEYGAWIRTLPVVARINRVVFLHGGLTPETAALGCAGINSTVHRELNQDFEKTASNPLATLAAGENGPLWYRGLAKEDETTFAPSVEKILQEMDARAIVVGHTVAKTGRIETRFGGRVVMIDAGMTEVYGGHRAALEIDADGSFRALYPDSAPVALPAAAAAR